ncbi:MAG: hypothetical protein IPJ34_06595 [Myxococcales bacterium]|nr:hypothetical protein [Myxococcales bacterium]
MTDRRTFAKNALRTLFAVGALAAVAGSTGCTRWTIVRQAAPSPLNAASKFVLEPMHWENTSVGGKPEAQYFADKEPAQQQSYATDKVEATGLFVTNLKSHAGSVQWTTADPQAFIVRPIVEHWEPGFYAVVARQNARMDLRLQILTPQGQVVDEITVWSTAQATVTSPSSGQRMRMCGEDLGGVVGNYLSSRLGGG